MEVEKLLTLDESGIVYSESADWWQGLLCVDEVHRRFDLPPPAPGAKITAVFSSTRQPDSIRLQYTPKPGLDKRLGVTIGQGVLVGEAREFTDSYGKLDHLLQNFPRATAWLSIYPEEPAQ